MTKLELENCIEEYGRDIYSFCRFLTHDRQEADELYQDIFLRAVEHCERIDILENPKGYLLSMAVRLWKDKQRKIARRQRIAPQQVFVEGWESDVGSALEGDGHKGGGVAETARNPFGERTEESPETAVLQKEMRIQVREAVASLPEKYRIVVVLYYMEEIEVAQMADILKIPLGTVKSRLFQARKRLKKKLECVYDD